MGKRTLRGFTIGTLLALVAAAPLAARAEVDKKTERTWKAKCASCHGADGAAQTDQGQKLKIADMTKADWQAKATDEGIKKAIVDGVQKDGQAVMEGYKDSLSPEQADSLVKLIRSLKK